MGNISYFTTTVVPVNVQPKNKACCSSPTRLGGDSACAHIGLVLMVFNKSPFSTSETKDAICVRGYKLIHPLSFVFLL